MSFMSWVSSIRIATPLALSLAPTNVPRGLRDRASGREACRNGAQEDAVGGAGVPAHQDVLIGTHEPSCGCRMRNRCNATWPPSFWKWSISNFCWAAMPSEPLRRGPIAEKLLEILIGPAPSKGMSCSLNGETAQAASSCPRCRNRATPPARGPPASAKRAAISIARANRNREGRLSEVVAETFDGQVPTRFETAWNWKFHLAPKPFRRVFCSLVLPVWNSAPAVLAL